jgi:hypothetical protein
MQNWRGFQPVHGPQLNGDISEEQCLTMSVSEGFALAIVQADGNKYRRGPPLARPRPS